NTAFLFFNVGISSFIILFMATFNRARIDLSRGQLMNYEGVGFAHFITIIPVIGIPFLLYRTMQNLNIEDYFPSLAFILGLIGILASKYILRLVTTLFLIRKYKISHGFRQQ